MPSTSKNSDEEYKEMLIELEECLEIYKDSHEVILCGDMNASMQRATGRDHLLHNFIKETQLTMTEKQCEANTFFHHNGKFTSKIDYFFVQDTNGLNIENIHVHEMNCLNCSDHTLIAMTLKTNITRKNRKTKKSHYTAKTKWEKCDVNTYRKEIKRKTNDFYNLGKKSTVRDKVKYVIDALHTAAKHSIPNYMKLKRLKRTGRGIWNPQIGRSSKEAKITFNKWKNSNRTCSATKLELKQ
ncbi:hypothetical protein DPMN_011522 [Dreissena polymorpha]|uniref:Endonuclease/exonuclease/phosphatase domain-containing protein n=1 Tax=Dreissena polymorpha TaxID=45954 RepID=A0A9D4S034_DREPO|nr:hypothetical protein DPMN_011521 [Dreissena polymorpha]KAH3887505.1 hypothetical protein DPMN_011522 [Dreissena polymorpha]